MIYFGNEMVAMALDDLLVEDHQLTRFQYAKDGKPCCPVGIVAMKLGATIEDLERWGTARFDDLDDVEGDADALRGLRAIQSATDKRVNYKSAIKTTREFFKHI